MATREELLAEAYRRNVLPPEMKAAYEELHKRGELKEPGVLERMVTGFMDPVYGGAQLGARMTPEVPGPDFDAYQKELQGTVDTAVREREKKYQNRRGPDAGIDIARGVGTALNPLTWAPLAIGGVAGAAAAGAMGGALEPVVDEDFGTEKAKQVASGTAIGTGLGVVGKTIGAGVRALGNHLAKIYPDSVMVQAVQAILRRHAQDEAAGQAPNMIDTLRLVNEADARSKPMTMTDVTGKNVERLAGHTYREGGEGASFMDKFLDERDRDAAQRLGLDLAQYVHPNSSVYHAANALQEARSAAAKPLWDQVRDLQGVWSPRLQELLDYVQSDPQMRAALNQGYALERLESVAERRPFNPTQMGVDLDAEGNVKIIATPNMRALHMLKMGLDGMISADRDASPTGKLSQWGVGLDKFREAYLKEIEGLDRSGIYKQARASWEGYSRSLDAIKLGTKVFEMDPEEALAEFANMQPGTQEFARIGVANTLRKKLLSAGFSGDEAKALLKNRWTEMQLQPFFRSPEEYEKFVQAVTDERTMFEKNVRIRRGSQTAERAAEDASRTAENIAFGARMALNLKAGNLIGAAKDAFARWRDMGSEPDPRVTEQIAKILFKTKFEPQEPETEFLLGQRHATGARYLRGPAAALEKGTQALAPGAQSPVNQPDLAQTGQ